MKKILVIDDDEVTREFVAHVLESDGCRVQTASEGAAGLNQARESSPDLVISDILMDGCDGYALLSGIREHPATASVPVILMSAENNPQGFRHGMVLGADDYLPKPFTAKALLDAVAAQRRKRFLLQRNAEKGLEELRANLTLALPHELNTPLNGIIGMAQLLKLKAESGDLASAEAGSFADDILVSADRLYRVFLNYLTYVQIELTANDPSAVDQIRRECLGDIGAVVASVAQQEASRVERSADLRLHLFGPVAASVSKGNLAKILSETVQNAFRFSAVGTEVVVEVRREDGDAVVSIRDHGRGMTTEQVRRIGAYAQFDRAIHAHEGLGLGLAIARRTTELHGGRLEVESEPGRGTKVTVRLKAE